MHCLTLKCILNLKTFSEIHAGTTDESHDLQWFFHFLSSISRVMLSETTLASLQSLSPSVQPSDQSQWNRRDMGVQPTGSGLSMCVKKVKLGKISKNKNWRNLQIKACNSTFFFFALGKLYKTKRVYLKTSILLYSTGTVLLSNTVLNTGQKLHCPLFQTSPYHHRYGYLDQLLSSSSSFTNPLYFLIHQLSSIRPPLSVILSFSSFISSSVIIAFDSYQEFYFEVRPEVVMWAVTKSPGPGSSKGSPSVVL